MSARTFTPNALLLNKSEYALSAMAVCVFNQINLGTIMKLKSTNQTVHLLPWQATATKPWDTGYSRVIIPATKANHKHNVQIVRNDNLV